MLRRRSPRFLSQPKRPSLAMTAVLTRPLKSGPYFPLSEPILGCRNWAQARYLHAKYFSPAIFLYHTHTHTHSLLSLARPLLPLPAASSAVGISLGCLCPIFQTESHPSQNKKWQPCQSAWWHFHIPPLAHGSKRGIWKHTFFAVLQRNFR